MSEQPWESYVSKETVLELHDWCISTWGGDKSPTPKEGCVEGSIGAAINAELYSGVESDTTGLCFAGCLLFYLASNHCFVDGNKRVAWASCMEALRNLGLTITATDDEAEAFCLDIATGTVRNAMDVPLWLAPRLEALATD